MRILIFVFLIGLFSCQPGEPGLLDAGPDVTPAPDVGTLRTIMSGKVSVDAAIGYAEGVNIGVGDVRLYLEIVFDEQAAGPYSVHVTNADTSSRTYAAVELDSDGFKVFQYRAADGLMLAWDFGMHEVFVTAIAY